MGGFLKEIDVLTQLFGYSIFKKSNNNRLSSERQTSQKTSSTVIETATTSNDLEGIKDALSEYLRAAISPIEVENKTKYIAFKDGKKNIACIVSWKSAIRLYLSINPDTVTLEEGFTRNMVGIGHWGTGNLEITITDTHSLEKAKSLIKSCYPEYYNT